MKTKSVLETAIICATGVIALAVITGGDGRVGVWTVVAIAGAIAVFMGFRYLTSRSAHRMQLTGSEQYRQLADEYRRLSDVAITAQEHTDLKLGDVTVQLDYLRAQVDSLQKILSEVE